MIVIAYLLGIGLFVYTGIRQRGTTPSPRTLGISGAIISSGALCVGLVILLRSDGGLGTFIALLAMFGGGWYLVGLLGSRSGARAMRVAGAGLMVVAFAIPSLLTLLFPVVAVLAGWTVRTRAAGAAH
jgi:hypothetical protein